ncbi:MAG TPA: hypothetical protein DDZ66_10330 [Firmicutes bacterium]|jgi:hypothetical protein|nr:hypothetical protein [Bacillota bacterium]
MLIRWVSTEDKPAWMQLARAVAELFDSPTMPADGSFRDYTARKISKFVALIAIDRMTGQCLGVIAFSRSNNRISWFAARPKRTGGTKHLPTGRIY